MTFRMIQEIQIDTEEVIVMTRMTRKDTERNLEIEMKRNARDVDLEKDQLKGLVNTNDDNCKLFFNV